MFCSNCGKADQAAGTYCRQCGTFLTDNTKIARRGFGGDTPQEQIRTNLYLNFMSGVVSVVSAILLYIIVSGDPIYGKQQVIYAIAAFLLAMGGWQFSAFIVNLKLRKSFQQNRPTVEEQTPGQMGRKTSELLPEANFSEMVPPSIVENTTRHLDEKIQVKRK